MGRRYTPEELADRRQAILDVLVREDRPITLTEFSERLGIRSSRDLIKTWCDELIATGRAERVSVFKRGLDFPAYQVRKPDKKPARAAAKPDVIAESAPLVPVFPSSFDEAGSSNPFIPEIKRLVEDILLTMESTRIQVDALRDMLAEYCDQPASLLQMLERYAKSTGQDLTSVACCELIPLLAGIAGRKARDPHRFSTNGFH